MANTKDEIIKFIRKRFPLNCDWLTGNCYYFAVILKERFCEYNPEIYYDVCKGHFVCKIEDSFYDWFGIVEHDKEYKDRFLIKWSTFHKYDELQFERIIRDVIK